MLAESAEERGHALEFVQFANKRNIPIELATIGAPNSQWESPEEVWADILKLEETNTANLLKVAEAANACQDYAVLAFLNPFHVSNACIFICIIMTWFMWLYYLNLWVAACLVDSLSLIHFIQYMTCTRSQMEQVDAEDKISTILAKVKDENKTPGLLRQLDHELGLEAGTA